MVGGKSLEGIPFATRVAIYGMPASLTTIEELYLVLNSELARAIKTHTAVEAALIASGQSGPWEYYLMLAEGDPAQAAKLQARAMLREMLNATR